MGNTQEEEESGIIPRAIKQLFDRLSSSSTMHLASVRVSMIELYNDECKDLLHPEILPRDIMIREDKHGRIFFTGAREEAVGSGQAALSFLELGNLNRSTAETLMNQASSRSHAIFTISLEMLEYTNVENEQERSFIHAKLHLVDLAGSERAKKTGASGTRFKESIGINQGLLSLGKVIRALTTMPISSHIPYRESKLTRFLQDSLGGNSRTLLLACISISEFNAHETISTLQYAHRARSVQNKVIANVTNDINNFELQAELESNLVTSLRAEIMKMQEQLTMATNSKTSNDVDHERNIQEWNQRWNKYNYLMKVLKNNMEAVLTECQSIPSAAELCHAALDLMNEIINTNFSDIRRSSSYDRSRSDNNIRKLPSAFDDLTEIDNLKQELADCKEDLKRDELIFAEKMKELKATKKQVKELEQKNNLLRENQSTLRKQLTRLVTIPRVQKSVGEMKESKAHGDKDDLDISLAVVAAEPDISQLMEDIEALVQEKECAMREVSRLEQVIRDMENMPNRERLLAKETRSKLQQEVKDLEVAYEGAEREIGDLRIANKRLIMQQSQHNSEHETLLSELDNLRSQLSATLREKEESDSAALKQLQDNHFALNQQQTRQIDQLRGKLNEVLDELRSIEEQHDKEKHNLQTTILEHKSTIERLEKELNSQIQEKSKLENKMNSIYRNSSLSNKLKKDEMKLLMKRLNTRIDELVSLGVIQVEISRLEKGLEVMITERDVLQIEITSFLQPIKPNQNQIDKIQSKLKQIEEKMYSLKVRADQLRMEPNSKIGTAKIELELQEIENSLESYAEHKAELVERLGWLSEEANKASNASQSSMLNDVQTQSQSRDRVEIEEELENLNTEIIFTQNRLKQQREFYQKCKLQNAQLSKDMAARLSVESESMDEDLTFLQGIDFVYQDLKLFGTRNLKLDPQYDSVLCMESFSKHCLQMIVDERIRYGASEAMVKKLQQQLEDKCNEYDNLVKTMQRMRTESIKKQEAVRKESDDKINFLLCQVKQLEQRSDSHNQPPSSSSMQSSLRIQTPNGQLESFSPYQRPPRSLQQSTYTPINRPFSGPPLPQPGSSLSLFQSHHNMGSPQVKNILQQSHQRAIESLKKEYNDLLPANAEKLINEDVIRRYSAERERRELLERRNTELAKEVKSLRAVLDKN